MIRADEHSTGAPNGFDLTVDPARAAAAAYFERPLAERAQEAFRFDDAPLAAPDVRDALHHAFGGKCAYCETPLTASEFVVDRFRPASEALDLAGGVTPDHYWWLAYAWENLYPCCADCRSFKGSRFPVSDERAAPGSTGEGLRAEGPLLLDPRLDAPESHLVFAEDGSVASVTPQGQATIDVLSLNRARLVASRGAALTEVRGEWDSLLARLGSTDPAPAEIEELFSATRPFAALRRQFVRAWAQSHRAQLEAVLQTTSVGANTVEEAAGDTRLVTRAERKRVKSAFDAREQRQEAYSLNAPAGEEYFGRTRRLERVAVKNFKVIRELDLTLPAVSSTRAGAPWLMLLGENGCGKSSLLQAIALTLMGAEARDALELDASSFVSNGTRAGHVEVRLAGATMPIRLDFRRSSELFRGEEEPKLLLLAYGATRLLPRGADAMSPPGGAVRVDNMFDPFCPIGNATGWLLDLDEARFDSLARGLKSLLDLGPDDRLLRNRRARRIEVEAFGTRVPLEHLSDGYQSVVALATDVMAVLLERWPTVDTAEGTVLIDELGAHLHPRWRMRIVPSLREVFPRVQFLASTHDPLCLRGLDDGEVTVMRREPGGEIAAVTDLPSIAGLRVDQLLTSEHFGLNSTIDPELDRLFLEYYELKAKRRPTREERKRHDELRDKLDELQVLGSTRRERIVLEAADEYVSRYPELADPTQRLELKDATKKRIAAIWERSGEGRRP